MFCIHLFFVSPLCLIMEKMNERSYFDVVSGSGKFIFAVSTGCLFGVCCNFNVQAILPDDHVQSYVSQSHRTPSQSCCAKSKKQKAWVSG